MDILSRFLNPIVAFLVTLAFGFWLSRRGKPYNGLLFNVHKLVALGTVILSTLAVYRQLKVAGTGTIILVLLLVAAVSVIALFASGAFMSANKGEYRVMKLVHNIAPFVAVFSMGYTAFLI